MNFVTVREFRTQSAKVWQKLAQSGEVVITSNGKPVAILSPVSPQNLEESLSALRRARAIAAVETMQKQSVAVGTDRLTRDDIQAEISAARKSRSR